jgi:ribose transport system permease protein
MIDNVTHRQFTVRTVLQEAIGVRVSDEVSAREIARPAEGQSEKSRPPSRFVTIIPIFLVLIVLSAVLAPSSVRVGQIQSLLYFAAILGFAALGQHLVVVVGGLDVSIGPTVTLAALMFAKYADSSGLLAAVLVATGAGAAIGLINGLAVTILRVTPLIATLGGGAIATGFAYTFAGQGAPSQVPDSYSAFLAQAPLGIPMAAYMWLASVLFAATVLRFTLSGRRFTAVGANPRASRAVGIPVDVYKAAAYVVGGALFAVTGMLVATAVTTPGLRLGDPYLLPSIAAVVIGGTVLGGGVGSVLATAGGTLFVVQLSNLTLALNGGPAIQQIVQGAVIVAAMAIYGFKLSSLRIRRRKVIESTDVIGPHVVVVGGESDFGVRNVMHD